MTLEIVILVFAASTSPAAVVDILARVLELFGLRYSTKFSLACVYTQYQTVIHGLSLRRSSWD